MSNLSKNIVLIGMPGVGKTSVGKKLSKIIEGMTLVDLDKEIEKKTGMKITEIFERNGEDFFRDLETQEIRELTSQNNLIITTGGGVVVRKENLDILRQNGLIFYLEADTATILKRLEYDKTRPLLKNCNKEEKLKTLLAERQKEYEKADFCINVANRSVKIIAEEILKLYEQ